MPSDALHRAERTADQLGRHRRVTGEVPATDRVAFAVTALALAAPPGQMPKITTLLWHRNPGSARRG